MAEDLMFKIGEEMVSKLISLAADEFTLAWNFQSDLENLQKSLKMVNALICDVSSSNNKAQLESVKVWLKELNEVAFSADVVLEDYGYETLKWKVENRKRDKVLALFSLCNNPLLFRQKLAHKIRKVKASVDEICKKGKEIGLIEIVRPNDIGNTAFNNKRLTHPYIDDESKIVGRENDVMNVVKMLCDDDDDDVNFPVIAIVGLAGQGKTTVAQMVYKNEKVVKHFDSKMIIWVCVSEEFVVTTLLNEMVQFFIRKNPQLSKVEPSLMNLNQS